MGVVRSNLPDRRMHLRLEHLRMRQRRRNHERSLRRFVILALEERGDHAMSIDAAVGWREGNQNGLHG